MPPTNDFLPFATGASPNVISQSAWAALSARASGFETGTALSDQLNKVWRQSQFQAVVLATLVQDVLSINVNDDGNVSAAVTNLTDAIEAVATSVNEPFTNLASAAMTDLGTIASRNVNVTGTVAITAFGASASVNQPLYFVTFAASLTLTNGAALLVPGGTVQTQAGDSLVAQYLGSGNWRVLAYLPATPPGTAFANLASAATTDLGTIPSQNVNVTGTTTITAFGSSASLRTPIYRATFAGVLTLTNGATLLLPGGANIVTAAGDSLVAQYLGSGNWRVLAYFSAAAVPPTFGSNSNGNWWIRSDGLMEQHGITAALPTGSNTETIAQSFPRVFSAAPVITANADNNPDGSHIGICVVPVSTGTGGTTFNCATLDVSINITNTVHVMWRAVGPP